MIVAIIGGIGSGKSLSGVKFMLERDCPLFTNFRLRQKKNIQRLRYDHIFKETLIEPDSKSKKTKLSLNWDFWTGQTKKHDGFDICIDEIHNIFNARRAMSKENVLLQQWVAQIRKILSGNERNHFIIISQRLERIDVSLRDLVGSVIYCQKVQDHNTLIPTYVYIGKTRTLKYLPKTYIIQFMFKGTYAVDNYQNYVMNGSKTYNYRTRFVANKYYEYFDSYELIDFGGEFL